MDNNETIGILNDLVQINNDRIAGYEKAINELKEEDQDLKTLFVAMIDESRKAKMELGNEVQVLGGLIDNSTTGSGQIYRAWMDVKAIFTGHSRKAVLSNCHFGEDAAQKAYQSALDSENVPAYIREMIANQKEVLKSSHDEVKAFAQQEATLH